ncbi:hypothetical protein [Kitasatospora sp. DSM 101779]|uniref:hypothetical protein n=1 Tax=Kitasatospora sp. DSM 101779 TaxID=2853165 RepID=UPI0021D90E32|nr:hypothetical protein [Kitasatospora sp. DSM 101779]MCU7820301.1 hypothetical protein [Kitasatospora sp. DSM 101779]
MQRTTEVRTAADRTRCRAAATFSRRHIDLLRIAAALCPVQLPVSAPATAV